MGRAPAGTFLWPGVQVRACGQVFEERKLVEPAWLLCGLAVSKPPATVFRELQRPLLCGCRVVSRLIAPSSRSGSTSFGEAVDHASLTSAVTPPDVAEEIGCGGGAGWRNGLGGSGAGRRAGLGREGEQGGGEGEHGCEGDRDLVLHGMLYFEQG